MIALSGGERLKLISKESLNKQLFTGSTRLILASETAANSVRS